MEIAQNLSDNKEWKSHGRPISRVELERLKLQIEKLEENKDVYEAVTAYNELMVDYIKSIILSASFRHGGFYNVNLYPNWCSNNGT